MNPKKRYVLQDFTAYALRHFSREFASVTDPTRYEFAPKTFLDANNGAHEIVMLLVGSYHKRRGGPSVWACATGSAIQYYQGLRSEGACTLIPEDQSARIYYATPFSAMTEQEGRGMTVGRKAGQIVIETLINFLFLWKGELKVVCNGQREDMLTNFKYACVKMQSALAGMGTSVLPPDQSADQQTSKKRKRMAHEDSDMEETLPRIKREVHGDDVLYIRQDYTSSASKKHNEHNFTYKKDPDSGVQNEAREHTSLLSQIKALQEKLDKQKCKIQAAEKKSSQDNERRRAAEKKTTSLENKLQGETRANGYLKTQLADSRKQTAEWKAKHAQQSEKALAWKNGAMNWKKVVDNLRAEASTPKKR